MIPKASRRWRAFACAALLLTGCPGERRMPDVLVVTCDTLRADRLHLYGHDRPTSPHLDALAKESVVFDRAYASSSFTPPSHASILTSSHVPTHAVRGWTTRLDPEVKTIAERLGPVLGYRTAAFLNLDNLQQLDLTRGFEHVRSGMWQPGTELNEDFFRWLDAAPATKPALAWLHFWDPHRPYGWREWGFLAPAAATPEQVAAMSPAARATHDRRVALSSRLPFPFNETLFGKGEPSVGRSEGHYNRKAASRSLAGALKPDDDRFLVDRYDGGVAFLDACLGDLVDGLRRRGRLDDTILVITSDHGESFTEREDEWFTHDPHLHEEVTHVPLLVRFPRGENGGKRVAELAQQIDVVPTVLDVLGRLRLESVQGRSLLPLVRGEAGPQSVFAETQTTWSVESDPNGGAAVESRTHRLQIGPRGRVEVFDRILDPERKRDLHADPPAMIETLLRKKLDAWLATSPKPGHANVIAERKVAVRTKRHRLIWEVDSDRRELYDLEADPKETKNLHTDPPGALEKELFEEIQRHLRETKKGVDAQIPLDPMLGDIGYGGKVR
ncbi:MAG TPA: sulfatase [Planctomycetota bacterium]|nr:sulfatase [Planctomycetota bacterium]